MAYTPQNTNGQSIMANSSPVVIASNQTKLPISVNNVGFFASTALFSTANIGAGASFTSTIETINDKTLMGLSIFSDQPITIQIKQYTDLAGTKLVSNDQFTRVASVGFNEWIGLAGLYIQVIVTNTGVSTTTLFEVNVGYGVGDSLPRAVTNNGNLKTALQEAIPVGSNRIGQVQITGGPTSTALGLGSTVSAYGTLRVTTEPSGLFNDPFDGSVIDTTNRWNTPVATGFAVTQAGGSLTLATNQTVGNNGFIDTIPTFAPLGINFTAFAAAVKLEAQVGNFFVTNQHRFIGLGNRPASFTITTPLLDAVGFEVDTTGQLNCVVYSNGTKVFSTAVSLTGVNINTLITPSNGYIRFGMALRADTIIFYIGSTEFPVATYSVASVGFTLPNIQALPIRLHAINSASVPNGASTFIANTLSLGDTGSNSNQISDGLFQWRKASVNAKGLQGTFALATQDLKDSGRNAVYYYSLIPVLATATDTLQSLTGTKASTTVVATTTPAVVTVGKTLRITRVAATYIATAVSGYGIVRLRANPIGVVGITSPVLATIAVGSSAPVTANATGMVEATLIDGLEFVGGTGFGVSVQGFTAVTPTAVGYVLVSITGYEY